MKNTSKYTEKLRLYEQIVQLDTKLNYGERRSAMELCKPLIDLLSPDDYARCSAVIIVEHSRLAISVIDRLLNFGKIQVIASLLDLRWNNDQVLRHFLNNTVTDFDLAAIYVAKTRQAYSRFSPAHAERISKLHQFIQRQESVDRRRRELDRLKSEVESAKGDLSRMTAEGRRNSVVELDSVKKDLKRLPRKSDSLESNLMQTLSFEGFTIC